jgi:immune inhibitor A
MRIKVWIALLSALLIAAVATPATGAPTPGAGEAQAAPKSDNRAHPLGEKKAALTERAMEAKLRGKAHGKTHEVARGQFVELERLGEDSIWTVLGEFSDFPHNNIAEPDRSVDNTTIWQEDFNRDYYMDILFSDAPGAVSMRNHYIEMSSNRYTVNGDVTDWVQVPGAAATYDDDLGNGAISAFLNDTIDGWYANMLAGGWTVDDVNDYLSTFDVWDRYDHDGDGNFDEADGYIDHFQAVHAGEGEEAGGGALGTDAIWSHRWYANISGIGVVGSDYAPYGGVQVGDSDYWIGDYTVEPENGGVGVFSHEFGHDLDLPDLYDTSGGENSTGFWTLMSSGSWLSDGTEDIGSRPGHMGAWEKFQLGWLNYEVAFAGAKSVHKLGPATTNTKKAQTVFVVLPDKEVTSTIIDPYAGEHFYYSESGNNLDHVMYKSFDLSGSSMLTAKIAYDIELDWDYGYVVISTDGGATWTSLETNHSTTTDPNGQNFGFGITGNSGGWQDLEVDLSGYSGDVLVGFRYWTDVAAVNPGMMLDEISVDGSGPDGAEGDEGWTLDGFRTSTGTETGFYFNAYVAEYRNYRGYDMGLAEGVYNFGFLDDPALGNYVERFPYQDGLLISYWDTSFNDNNTNVHPGGGLVLPIDAHPNVMYRADGGVWRNRVQTYDATFSIAPTDAITLHWLSEASEHPSLPGKRAFKDTKSYWRADNPTGSVQVPNTGTMIKIRSISALGNFMQIVVRPVK